MLLESRMVDDEPFEKLVAAHHAEVHRYLRRVVSRETEAEHLYQETFLRAFRARGSRPADVDGRTWLFAIATHLCRSQVRSERRWAAIPAGREAPRSVDGVRVEGEGVFHRARGRLEASIRCLPVAQRLAFTMRKLHGLDYAAIGASLDCSAEVARTHVLAALRRIRRGLNGSRNDVPDAGADAGDDHAHGRGGPTERGGVRVNDPPPVGKESGSRVAASYRCGP